MDVHRPSPELPDPVENRRASSGKAVRLVYLLGLFGFVAVLSWHFLRFMLFLEGSGTITAKKFFLSVPYSVHIESVEVVAGSRVKRDDVIATVSSFEVQQYQSALLTSISDLLSKESELQIRASIAKDLLLPAALRLEIAKETTARFQKWADGKESTHYRIDIFRELSNATEFSTHAQVEAAEVAKQLLRQRANRLELERRLADSERQFNEGRIVAPIDGVVGFGIAEIGQSVPLGQSIASVYDTSEIYIDWEMPLRRLVEPKIGDKVFITTGYSVMEGSVDVIYPISTSLGTDRRDYFSTTPQGQTARVKNHGFDALLPIDSAVTVRMNYTVAMTKLFEVFQPLFRK